MRDWLTLFDHVANVTRQTATRRHRKDGHPTVDECFTSMEGSRLAETFESRKGRKMVADAGRRLGPETMPSSRANY